MSGLQAYNELLQCIIPAKQLLILPPVSYVQPAANIVITLGANSRHHHSTLYWTQLVSFLRPRLPTHTLASLIQFGIPHSELGSDRCTMSGTEMNVIGAEFRASSRPTSFPCQTHQTVDTSTRGTFVPSVCAASEGWTVALAVAAEKTTANEESSNPLSHLHQCASDYATTLASLFGAQFRDIIMHKLTAPRVVTRHSSNATIILNIGPGSSGTRSLFTAIRQLNITARHYQDLSLGCRLYRITSNLKHPYLSPLVFSDDFSPLLDPQHQRVFWGDIPVPEMWWYILQAYPQQTQFIMTDINATKWYHSRFKYFCNNSYVRDWNGCTSPVPFSFLLNRERQISPTEKTLTRELLVKMQLMNINVSTSNAVYQAYRDIVRCAFPPERKKSASHLPHLFSPHPQLLWLDMTQQTEAPLFWSTLVSFLRLHPHVVSDEKLSALWAAGVPYMGSNGCYLGEL
eukprot:gene24093-30396_t